VSRVRQVTFLAAVSTSAAPHGMERRQRGVAAATPMPPGLDRARARFAGRLDD
jgi:hypothetical protein